MAENYDIKHRIETEQAILGSILVDSKISKETLFKHGVDDHRYFLKEQNQNLYYCILQCWKENIKPDLITISKYKNHFLKVNGKESSLFDIYVIELTQKISSTAHLDSHILIFKQYVLFEYWNKRMNEIQNSIWNERDVFIVSENIIEEYQLLKNKFTEGIKVNDNKVLEAQRVKYDKIKNGEYFTIPTTIESFDSFSSGGWHPAELTIIAGRPGMGKTSITLSLAKLACYEKSKRGAFLSLEMPKVQLQNRIIAELLHIDYKRIKSLTVTQDEFNKIEEMYKWFDQKSTFKIYDRNDCPNLASIEKLLNDNNFEFMVIDYLQLISLDGKTKSNAGNREQEISEISRSLKSFATTFDIPIIALSQLSRAVESRPNKRPILSDLRESGSIEQDADNVIFIYRDSYYRLLQGQIVPEIEKGNFEFIIAKGREMGTEKFNMHIDFRSGHISDYFIHTSDHFVLPERNNPTIPIAPKIPLPINIPPVPKP